MKRKYLRNILQDIFEFLGSHFLFLLAITFGILIVGVIILQYYDIGLEPPLVPPKAPVEPHMRP